MDLLNFAYAQLKVLMECVCTCECVYSLCVQCVCVSASASVIKRFCKVEHLSLT